MAQPFCSRLLVLLTAVQLWWLTLQSIVGAVPYPSYPMDIVSPNTDPNGLLYNPTWRLQSVAGNEKDVGDRELCVFRLRVYGEPLYLGDPPCTQQHLIFTSLLDPSNLGCRDALGRGVDGEVAWPALITMQGKIAGGDRYRVGLIPGNGGLLTRGRNSLMVSLLAGLGFLPDGLLWSNLYKDPSLVGGRDAIVTGMFGLHCAVDPAAPMIEPAFAASINIQPSCRLSPGGKLCVLDKYMVFGRTLGTTSCGNGDAVRLDLPADNHFTVSYPWDGPKGVGITVVSNIAGGGVKSVGYVTDTSIDVTYEFPSKPDGFLAGDLIVVYGAGPVFARSRQFTSQGGWSDSGTFISADFTGGGRADTAYIFNEDGQISIDVYVNNGDDTFTQERWATQVGSWRGNSAKFMAGDFDGDGRIDIAYAFNHDGAISIDVHANLGRGFGGADQWANQQGGWSDSGRFIAGDFTGDGTYDIAFIFSADDLIAMDVHANTGQRSFKLERWTGPYTGGWIDDSEFLVGDFDGDGALDVAFAFNHDGAISIDTYVNTGQRSFNWMGRWATRSGSWQDNHALVSGDFNGDGKTDIGHIFKDQSESETGKLPARISIDVHASTGTSFEGPETWAGRTGGWSDNMRFTVADFNGDGAPDIAVAFDTDGRISQDLYRNLNVPSHLPPETPPWSAGTRYAVGDRVVYDGIVYEALQAHVSQPGWEPPKVPPLFVRFTPKDGSEWAVQTFYRAGSVVKFGGVTYRCIQGHESLPGWDPPSTPALWIPVS